MQIIHISLLEDLYTNKEGAGTSLAAAWSTLASTLGTEPAVIGYDILNEPWTGDAFQVGGVRVPGVQDGALLLPGHAGHRLLAPLYARIHAAIRWLTRSRITVSREVDRDKLVLWEGVTWTHWLPDPRPSLAAAAAALLRSARLCLPDKFIILNKQTGGIHSSLGFAFFLGLVS